jgi:hypothetical protein
MSGKANVILALGLAVIITLLLARLAPDYDIDERLILFFPIVILARRFAPFPRFCAWAAVAAASVGVAWTAPPTNWGELLISASFVGLLAAFAIARLDR